MNNFFLPILGAILLCISPSIAQDNLWSSARPDGHAPISVMGDHYHKKGEFMFSYRYMPMWMDGNLSGSSNISNAEVFADFAVVPQKMIMEMQMLSVMYAPSNYITLMLMGSYVSKSMDLRTRMGVDFTTESSGLGDTSISGLVKILNTNKQSLHANVGFSIPTGDIEQRDDTPMMANVQLAYPMQLGSGTLDPFLGATYSGQSSLLSWGVQSTYKLRLGDNSRDYSLGNKFDGVAWLAIKANEYFSFSTSLSFFDMEDIEGADADLNPRIMPLFSTANSGRSQLDLGIGSNFLIPHGNLKNLRLAAEVKFPITQDVNGIQMKNEWGGTFGIQYALGH